MGDLLNIYLIAGRTEEYSNSGIGTLALCWELLIDGMESRRCSQQLGEAFSSFPEANACLISPDGHLLYTDMGTTYMTTRTPP